MHIWMHCGFGFALDSHGTVLNMHELLLRHRGVVVDAHNPR